jgi:hypothetical protein
MPKQLGYFIIIGLIFGALIGALFYFYYPRFSAQVELSEEFESSAFRLNYPKDWQYQIPQPNLFFLASPEILLQELGASMTIQRSVRLSAEVDTLEAGLNLYLERGALRADRAWSIVEAIQAVEFNGRDGLFVSLEGAEQAGDSIMRSEIYITLADNQLMYIFTVVAPQASWEESQATFRAILDSIVILE